jgi:hypothetical protein
MANTTELRQTAADHGADEALAWLVAQLRWERTLERLHRVAAGEEPLVAERAHDQAA